MAETRPGGRTARTREAVHAALRALLAEGREPLTVREVSTRSGVHEVTIYRRWKNMDERRSARPRRRRHPRDRAVPVPRQRRPPPGSARLGPLDRRPGRHPRGLRVLPRGGQDYTHDLPPGPPGVRGSGPFWHELPGDRDDPAYSGRTTLHGTHGQRPYLLLPLIPAPRHGQDSGAVRHRR